MVQLKFGPFITTSTNSIYTTATVSGVIVDVYTIPTSGSAPSVGQGTYGGVSDGTGLAYVNFGGGTPDNWEARFTYPIGAWNLAQPSFQYQFIEELTHWDF